jgi:hypothetical protein
MIMRIPCKECLILAACRSKEIVVCQLLYEWGTNKNLKQIKDSNFFYFLPKCSIVRQHRSIPGFSVKDELF